MESQALLVSREKLAKSALLDSQVFLVLREMLELPGQREDPDCKDHEVKLVNLVKLECLERLVLLEKMGQMERREALEVLVRLDHQAFQVREDNPV